MRIFSSIKGFFVSVREGISRLREKYLFFRIVINKWFIVGLGFALWIFIFNSNNIFVWFDAKRTISNQEKRIVELEQEIRTTENRIECLSSQKDTLERFAREEYFFHEKGEEIYIIDNER